MSKAKTRGVYDELGESVFLNLTSMFLLSKTTKKQKKAIRATVKALAGALKKSHFKALMEHADECEVWKP